MKSRSWKKTMLTIVSISVIVVASFSLFLFSPWIYSFFQPTPPQPTIRYGEFPFRLEYEINGRVVVVEDTIMCKYKGIGVSFGTEGKFLKWEGYLLSRGEKSASESRSSTSLLVDKINQIYFYLHHPSHYLGAYGDDNESSLAAWSPITGRIISTDELWDKYNIRIISFEPSPPIKNTFK